MIRKLTFLLMAFLSGAVFAYAGLNYKYEQTSLQGYKTIYEPIAQTKHWDVLIPEKSEGRSVALGQNGAIRVVVLDDGPSLYVLTYKNKESRIWEGRLIDKGNDGTIEIANTTGKQCELDVH